PRGLRRRWQRGDDRHNGHAREGIEIHAGRRAPRPAPHGRPDPDVPPRQHAAARHRLPGAVGPRRRVPLAGAGACRRGLPRCDARRGACQLAAPDRAAEQADRVLVRRRLRQSGAQRDADPAQHLSVAGGITKSQVRRLMRAGWEIDAHTITHPDLTTLDAGSLRHEVSGSRAALRRDFGVPVDNFAYPAGRYDPAAEAAVRAAGFRTAVTTELGLAHMNADRAALPRVRVNGTDSAAAVLQAVESAQ
ncbi:MAG: polysaccharide deacetylase family protein, partial [Actinobacteria bacterium]